MIVLVTETGAGQVVHWYTNKGDTPLEEIAFASFSTALYVETAPPEVIKDALEANAILKKDPHANVDHYATHVRDGVWLKPVIGEQLYRIWSDGEVKDNG